MVRLFFNMVIKFVVGFLFMVTFLFLSAGSLFYFNAWLFLALLFIPMLILGIILFVKAPDGNAQEMSEKAKKHELLLVPSDSFGVPGFVRIAYCVSRKTIEDSLPAFRALMEEYQ